MKKIIAALSIGAAVFSVSAQSESPSGLVSKRGIPLLPEAGEYSIGIGASPFLSFLGNSMNNSFFNNDPSWNPASTPFGLGAGSLSISGKKMNTATDAYRFRFQFSHTNANTFQMVVRDTVVPDPDNLMFEEDAQKINSNYLAIALGKEWRRGKSRVQGVYGAEAFFELAGTRSSFEYGNEISQDFNSPTSFNYGSNLIGPITASSNRVLERKSGLAFGIGARGFAGVEYFVAPRLSIGAEFGYAIRFQHIGQGELTFERFDAASLTTVEKTVQGQTRTNNFSVGLDNLSGLLNLQFYF